MDGVLGTMWRLAQEAWKRVLCTVSPRHRYEIEYLAALERGEGASIFTWCWGDAADAEAKIDALMAQVDQAVRRAPSPLGADESFVRVAAYGPLPGDAPGDVPLVEEGREIVRRESLLVDRYHDWKKGDAPGWVRQILGESVPCAKTPIVAVGVFPFGGALAYLLREGIVRPASPWMH